MAKIQKSGRKKSRAELDGDNIIKQAIAFSNLPKHPELTKLAGDLNLGVDEIIKAVAEAAEKRAGRSKPKSTMDSLVRTAISFAHKCANESVDYAIDNYSIKSREFISLKKIRSAATIDLLNHSLDLLEVNSKDDDELAEEKEHARDILKNMLDEC
jgi:hypothetical protein